MSSKKVKYLQNLHTLEKSVIQTQCITKSINSVASLGVSSAKIVDLSSTILHRHPAEIKRLMSHHKRTILLVNNLLKHLGYEVV
jgi:hypothetical protein